MLNCKVAFKSLFKYRASLYQLRLPTSCQRLQFSDEGKKPVDDENAFSKTYRILSDDFRFFRGKRKELTHHVDVVIIGGGIFGSSVAYWMKRRAPASFTQMVIEKDPTFSHSCTTLSVGGIRQQFSLPENIQLSMASAEFLRHAKKNLHVEGEDPPDIQYQPIGYLFLSSEEGVEQMKENYRIQKDFGAKVELLTAKQLKENFPWLNTDGIALGSYGLENEGRFDPWILLRSLQKKASSWGTEFFTGEVIGFEFDEVLEMRGYVDYKDVPYRVNRVLVKEKDGDIHTITFSMLVIAAGSNSGKVAEMLKIGTGRGLLSQPLPVEPRKRYVYVCHCPDGPTLDLPLMIDPSGTYAVREGFGGLFLAGKSPEPSEEPDVSSLDVDYQFFDNCVWPKIAERIPAFEKIKLKSAWAGYYDYNYFDQNGVIGPHPYYRNVYFATGFSGHGIQMAPAVGRAMMEFLLDGDYKSIDLYRLGFHRFIENDPLFEKHIV